MNEFKMFSADRAAEEIPANSADFRAWLVRNRGDEIKSRELEEIQTCELEGGIIVTIEIGLIAEAFGEKSKDDFIRVQVEDGEHSYETTWDALENSLKKSVLEKIG